MDPDYLVTVIEPKYGENPIVHEKLYAAYRFASYPSEDEKREEREYDGPAWTWVADGPISVINKGKTIHNMNSGNRSAIGSKPMSAISPKIWSIKVDKLESGGKMRIIILLMLEGWVGLGVAPENARTLSFSGSEQMWMYSANSYAWPAQRMEGFAYTVGDIITISLDVTGKLRFKKNGQDTGKTLTGFPDLNKVSNQ